MSKDRAHEKLVERTPARTSVQERHWLEANQDAIEAYNRRVTEHGLLSDHAGPQ